MLDSKVAELLNDQINKEMYSAYLYLDFSNFYANKGLNGYANWYHIQAKEEMDHALGILNYLQDNDYAVSLSAIAKPDKELVHLDDPLKFGLEHEIYVTQLIHRRPALRPCCARRALRCWRAKLSDARSRGMPWLSARGSPLLL